MIINLIFGFLLVTAGRNFFWLCVGVVGFLIGVQSAVLLGFSNSGVAILVAIALGLLGALLAISFEWLAVVIGVGFLGGGYLFMGLFSSIVPPDAYTWLIFVVGGIIGICLTIIAFDWALIIISSLLGATLIANAFYGTAGVREIIFVSSMMAGIFVQYLLLQGVNKQEHYRRRSNDH